MSEPLTSEELEQLEQIIASLPAEVWTAYETGTWPHTNHFWGIGSDKGTGQVAKVEGYGEHPKARAAFIASARSALPRLIEEVKELRRTRTCPTPPPSH